MRKDLQCLLDARDKRLEATRELQRASRKKVRVLGSCVVLLMCGDTLSLNRWRA